jgi:osmoprotectant transport system permease protein
LLTDLLFALLQRVVVPRGVTAGRAKDVRTSSSRRRAVVETATERK